MIKTWQNRSVHSTYTCHTVRFSVSAIWPIFITSFAVKRKKSPLRITAVVNVRTVRQVNAIISFNSFLFRFSFSNSYEYYYCSMDGCWHREVCIHREYLVQRSSHFVSFYRNGMYFSFFFSGVAQFFDPKKTCGSPAMIYCLLQYPVRLLFTHVYSYNERRINCNSFYLVLRYAFRMLVHSGKRNQRLFILQNINYVCVLFFIFFAGLERIRKIEIEIVISSICFIFPIRKKSRGFHRI